MKYHREINHKVFSEIYITYFPKLVRFTREYVIDKQDAENVVQDMFLYLWEHREMLDSVSNINAFLYTLMKNRCIDYYRHTTRVNTKRKYLSEINERELHLKMEALKHFDTNLFVENELEELLEQAITKLPEKCRRIFIMSRIEGLKHEEIARTLDISVYTVQNHISSALRKLKIELKDYLPLLTLIIFRNPPLA